VRIGQINQGRPAYYDRNATTKLQNYFGGFVAPAGSVIRWVYTVPSNTKSFVQSAMAEIKRSAAAAPVGQAEVDIQVTAIATGTAADILVIDTFSNAIDAGGHMNAGSVGLFVPGDIIRGITYDASTGGTVAFGISIIYAEFDA
jgi:hypothetical protein